MWCNVIFIVIVFTIAFIGFTGYSLAKDNANNLAPGQHSRVELADKLGQLPPKNFLEEPMGAMCYDTAVPLNRTQFICPICGEMTVYHSSFGDNIEELPTYLLLVRKITKIDVKLDDTQFCKKCNPGISSPQYCLLVKYGKNEEAHKTCGITDEDINLLYEFSEGSKDHITSYTRDKRPMTEYKKRLEELLGTKIKI
ncbi:MAG: hypothetical protein PHC34_11895 [Candidatus Gastranaerophilales bacterium]|nr:hypothetical protein [Candidatus Gastranaerophilales bacterium]